MYWREVKLVRKGENRAREGQDGKGYVNGHILLDGVEVKRRLAESFEWVLNVEDEMEANINVISDWQIPVLGDLNEREISIQKVREAVNEMKSGKAPGLDGFPVLECLKEGGMAV